MIALPRDERTWNEAELAIAVAAGGESPEAEVSRASGEMVAEALRGTFGHVEVVEPSRALVERLGAGQFDVVFPVLHGPLGEDGAFQGLLEIAHVAYVGSGVLASACALDKVVSKHIFRALGLPVANDVVIEAPTETPNALRAIRAHLGERVVVKPASQGSAIGVTFADRDDELERALAEAHKHGPRVLIEERLDGAEITVGVLETDRPHALPAIEVRTPPGTWYDFEHRYTPGLSHHVIPAPLPPDVTKRVQEIAVGAHLGLGCRDLSRVDLVVTTDGRPYLLEVNTLPGMTPTSLYPDAAKAAGITFEELTAYLVSRALTSGRTPLSAARGVTRNSP